MPREVFIAGQILTAAEMNTVSDQTVMVFAGTAARGSAIPSPSEGMVTYLSDVNQVQAYTGAAFTSVSSILQVVSTTKTDAFSGTGSSFVDVTGLSATITPTSSSNKIYVSFSGSVAGAGGNPIYGLLLRGSTPISVGATVGSRSSVTFNFPGGNSAHPYIASAVIVDSPNTTSAVTYKLQLRSNGATAFYVNRSVDDTNDPNFPRTAATITLMEVAG